MTPDEVARRGVLACLIEAAAPKPGNVSPGRPAGDAEFAHFAAGALAIAPALAAAARGPGREGGLAVGAAIRRAVEATRAVVQINTNLGIVLLLVPLARAAGEAAPGGAPVVAADALRGALAEVLRGLDVADARDAYAAIRLAAPGGLGAAEREDVAKEPTVPLRDAMRLAEHRDDVAREYAADYPATFELGLPALASAAGLGAERAVVHTALTLLAARPDTLIARKAGADTARAVSGEARAVLDLGGVRTREGRRRLAALDRALRAAGGRLNPGTTADLVAASLFAFSLSRGPDPFASARTAALRRRRPVM